MKKTTKKSTSSGTGYMAAPKSLLKRTAAKKAAAKKAADKKAADKKAAAKKEAAKKAKKESDARLKKFKYQKQVQDDLGF